MLVVIALIATLAALMFPVLAQVRGAADARACGANLGQIGSATAMYASDNDSRYPSAVDAGEMFNRCAGADPVPVGTPAIQDALDAYAKSRDLWRCPSDRGIPALPPTGPEEGSDCYLPGTAPSVFRVYGNSYAYRSDLAREGASHPATGFEPGTGREVGPAEIAIFYDMHGSWHGGQLVPVRRWNTLLGDGHVKLLSSHDLGKARNYETHPRR
jgi:type II secretory pathway pseudopilin PulG